MFVVQARVDRCEMKGNEVVRVIARGASQPTLRFKRKLARVST